MKKHEAEVRETMRKLESAEYKINPKKCEFFKNEIKWIGHEIYRQDIHSLQNKV